MYTKRAIHDTWSPWICIISPVICYFVNLYSVQWFYGYQVGFEVLVLNGLLTYLGLVLISRKERMNPEMRMQD